MWRPRVPKALLPERWRRPVVVVRSMPPALARGGAPGARGYYYDRLWRGWSPGERALALLLNGAPGWRPAKRRAWWLGFRAANLREIEQRRGPGAAMDAFLDQDERKGIHAVLNHAGLPLPRDLRRAEDLEGLAAIIVKPRVGSKGRGVRRFVRAACGDWTATDDGERLDRDAMSRWIAAARESGHLVQQCVGPDPAVAPISPGALPTLRIVTMRDEDGGHEATDAALRLSLAEDRAADNFNRDNLVAPVALADGRLGPALRRTEGGFTEHARHPLTDAPIAGEQVGQLAAAVALARAAHRLFDDHVVIGWDIGVAEHGPVLIEGNWNPGYNVLQLSRRRGLGGLRMGALYRHHLGLSEAGWAAASPIQSIG